MNVLRVLPAAATAGLILVLAACQPSDSAKDAGSKAATAKGAADGDAIPGLPTEKDRVSYMIGLDMGRSLQPIKDEVDVDVMMRALKASLAGQKPLMTEEQALRVREAFAQRLQAKQIAEMMAKAKKNAEDGEKFLAANAKKPNVKTTASGLQYEVLRAGNGPTPKPTDTVLAHYRGALLDGTEFDSSYSRNEPATFRLDQVVPGWSEGVALMPVGSKYRFWIPAKLGYGEQGTPGGPIPPNATLVFEVELLEIK
ncbi:MAG TPA: FKBP-type peptidyl-prolyl cis-trans isomerase [Lysobacter sp.]|nr:FKBP-type peptidyl-prolyl cis-trans isomerase [Lysobacter sp.]